VNLRPGAKRAGTHCPRAARHPCPTLAVITRVVMPGDMRRPNERRRSASIGGLSAAFRLRDEHAEGGPCDCVVNSDNLHTLSPNRCFGAVSQLCPLRRMTQACGVLEDAPCLTEAETGGLMWCTWYGIHESHSTKNARTVDNCGQYGLLWCSKGSRASFVCQRPPANSRLECPQ
jgi:hypothetical protein